MNLGSFEWILILLIGLGLGVWELINIRRAVRRDREGASPPPARDAER